VATSDLRPLMFSVAYGMLGSATEAEDVAQEALLRLHRQSGPIEKPAAFAVTVTTRLAIDRLRSAQARREVYVGAWLPEPLVVSDPSLEPAALVEAAERLSMAFLVMLERLSPVERAVLLLREVFGYDYDRVAEIVERSEANCRQIMARARVRVREERPRFEASPQRRDELVRCFFEACRSGDLAGLEKVLAEDITFVGDGGGQGQALRAPVDGRRRVARFLLGLFRVATARGARAEPVLVNGAPGARVFGPDGHVAAVFALDLDDEGIHGIYNVVNPDKLVHCGL